MSDEVASNDLAEKREQFAAKQTEMASVLKIAGDGTDVFNLSRAAVLKKLGVADSAAAADKIREMDAELQTLGVDLRNAEMKAVRDRNRQREELRGEPADDTFRHPVEVVRKSFGELFTSTKSFVEGVRNRQPSNATIDLSLKTLFATTAGFAPESLRTGQIVPAAVRPPQLLDYITVRATQYELVKYMEETTATFNAAEKAEGVAYGESVFVYTERESPVRKITISLPVTDEQLQDAPEVAAILDTRLRFGIMQRLDQQIFNGNGSPPNLLGLLSYVSSAADNGDIQTLAQAGGGVGDSIFDAVFSAMMAVRTTGRANPNLVVLHPTDWAIVRLTRTDLGEYVMGNPGVVGTQSLFGLPVALVEAGSAGTGLVGDFANFSYVAERRGIDVQAGYSGTQFVEGKKTLRADLRAAFVVLRPAAFCSMTSLAAPAA
jgi:HK97 family phage major capsid protein